MRIKKKEKCSGQMKEAKNKELLSEISLHLNDKFIKAASVLQLLSFHHAAHKKKKKLSNYQCFY